MLVCLSYLEFMVIDGSRLVRVEQVERLLDFLLLLLGQVAALALCTAHHRRTRRETTVSRCSLRPATDCSSSAAAL